MNQLFVTIIIILLPGIIATVIADKLTVHSKWDSFKYGLYSFVLGIFTYSILQIVMYIIDILAVGKIKNISWTHLNIWTTAISDKPTVSSWEIIFAVFLAVPISFFTSWLINYKIFTKIAQKLNITSKFGDENLYSYYLNSNEIDWIYVRDPEKNLTYLGRVVSYSENDKIQELVLSEVTIYRYEDSAQLYSVPTIYLSKEMGKFVIEAMPTELKGENDEKETTN